MQIGQFWLYPQTLRKRHFFKISKNGSHSFNYFFYRKLITWLDSVTRNLLEIVEIFENFSKTKIFFEISVKKFSKIEIFPKTKFVHFFTFFRLESVGLHDFFSKKKKFWPKIRVSKISRQKKINFDFRRGYILRHPKDSSWRVESNGEKKMIAYFNTSRSKMAKTDFSFSGHLDFCFLKNSQNSK